MNREELERLLALRFGVEGERLFARYPSFSVYRHRENRKWFAVLMDIPKGRLGLKGEESISVVNLKCYEDMAADLWQEPGIFPAYHMNKRHWITVLLDGSVSAEKVESLLSISFALTGKGRKQ